MTVILPGHIDVFIVEIANVGHSNYYGYFNPRLLK